MHQSQGSIPAAEKEGGRIKTRQAGKQAGRHEEVKRLAGGHQLSRANSPETFASGSCIPVSLAPQKPEGKVLALQVLSQRKRAGFLI